MVIHHLSPLVLSRGLIFVPRGTCGTIGRQSGFFGVGGGATGISGWGVEATDATIHRPLRGADPATENYSSSRIHRAEVEKL